VRRHAADFEQLTPEVLDPGDYGGRAPALGPISVT